MDAPLVPLPDDGLGYDMFGLHRSHVVRALRWGRPALSRYFRVDAHGAEHLLKHGAAIVIANHSGVLPVDGAMLWLDVARQTGRVLRVVADRFVPELPFVGTQFARVGVVAGTRANVELLLARGELVAIFPEGTTGVAKTWRHRYQLQAWRVGHVELAIRHRVPIIPVAIIGAEESWPLLARLDRLHPFGAPYLPVPAVPVPLPVRYHVHYGAPLRFDAILPEAADDPEIVARAAAITRGAVEELISQGRRSRS